MQPGGRPKATNLFTYTAFPGNSRKSPAQPSRAAKVRNFMVIWTSLWLSKGTFGRKSAQGIFQQNPLKHQGNSGLRFRRSRLNIQLVCLR